MDAEMPFLGREARRYSDPEQAGTRPEGKMVGAPSVSFAR